MKIAESLDFHKDGKIQYSEFITASLSISAKDKKEDIDDRLNAVFKMFDLNDIGYITSKSVIEALEKNDLQVDHKKMEEFFDNQNKQKLNLEEFKNLIKKQ